MGNADRKSNKPSEEENKFDHLKSKIRDLHIPLPNFEYFHKPSSEEKKFDNFIGREEEAERLEEWLANGDSGAYLVTGYRGMGKTSLVGKVLNKIARTKRKKWIEFLYFCILFIFGVGLLYSLSNESLPLRFIFISFLVIVCLYGFVRIRDKTLLIFQKCRSKRERKNKKIDETAYQNHKNWFSKVFDLKKQKNIGRKYYQIININLGHENLREKDILSLVAKRICDKYEEYLNSFYTNWTRLIAKNIAFLVIAFFFVWFLSEIKITGIIIDIQSPRNDILAIIRNLVKKITSDELILSFGFAGFFPLEINITTKIITKAVLFVILYFISKRFYNFAVSKIPLLKKNSSEIILEELKSLIDRIDASVTERSEQSGRTSSFLSFGFSRKKDKVYPIASTREIEDQLIQILYKIGSVRSTSPPKFIIVFDELDKIDPVYNHLTKAEQNIPEFEISTSFQGGSAMRDRKQNMLRLLGNMKLFMSQAKAKFVFISGRELYDASFADLVDREFAISSIFSTTPINVDSFLRSSNKEKNTLTKTEEYICGYLIPEKYYKEKAVEQYKKTKESDKTEYLYPNLRLYKKFLEEKLISEHTEIDESEHKNRLAHINKTIVFLNKFSIYLTHICNGSPKKITLYFEKYIKTFIAEHEKNLFSKINNKDIKKSKYCLSFDAFDQQNIGFVNYMTYPIVQTIINNSSHFGDKMLVSVSFLIDHIFKHHKGGFSYENIEQTPELLEVYSIPHMRTMIDTILSFLKQNHATEIYGGIYQYRFRQSVADEILYNSRLSEEISALFNFTLDESLPVKRHYYRQIAENEKKYLALEERIHTTPAEPKNIIKNQYTITLASQLETLGEIHLWDEEYNESIEHLQSAFEIIKTELKRTSTDKNKLQLYTLLIRTALKLGLVKERKGYYDEAFVIYNTLINYLAQFRGLGEATLGLNYFFEDNELADSVTGKDKKNGEWKNKKAKIYHNIHGRILSDTKPFKGIYSDVPQHKDDFRYEYWMSKNEKFTKETQGASKDEFYNKEIYPFYREMGEIQGEEIDFLMDTDHITYGLSKMLSSEKQEIISRLTLFSEVKSVFQVILANLFIVEKIDYNGITQENLELAENQFDYLYLLTDSKEKFIQAVDFYKKMASILFLKNHSNPQKILLLKMWGFDIYEIINEFCFIRGDKYNAIVECKSDGVTEKKFPKEILREFVNAKKKNEENSSPNYYLWKIFTKSEYSTSDKNKVEKLYDEYTGTESEKNEKSRELILDFVKFVIGKRDKYFIASEIEKCEECYKYCEDREKNHPSYACSYVSKSLNVFKKVFTYKYKDLFGEISHEKKPFFFKLLEHSKKTKINNNYFLVLASALRIKADVLLSCVNGKEDNTLGSNSFPLDFLKFMEEYYASKEGAIKEFIKKIENTENKHSKLEKSILYYWLSAEYFYLSSSPVDANENLTKILIIFDKYITIGKELKHLIGSDSIVNPLENDIDLFAKIQDTIVRRILKNSSISNDNVNHIEVENLKHILRSRSMGDMNLSNLSTRAGMEEALFSYCKLELSSVGTDKTNLYLDCYKSTLLNQNRLSFTVQEKIRSFEFKERMNMAILEKIIPNLNFYASKGDLRTSFEEKNIDGVSNLLQELKIQENSVDKMLQFLIKDSLFCLTRMVEILSSGKFSNYSHSFVGDAYHQISKWAELYEYMDEKESIRKHYKSEILNDIGAGNRHFLDPAYSAAMALKYYHKAIGINSEKEEYKEMIRGIYIVNDDISNGMQCFSLALERYTMNCGVIEKKMDKLREYYKESLSHELKDYLKDI